LLLGKFICLILWEMKIHNLILLQDGMEIPGS
jgi:hypothetical protein